MTKVPLALSIPRSNLTTGSERQLDSAHQSNALFGQSICCLPSGEPLALCEGEDAHHDAMDAFDATGCLLFVVALELERAVHQPTGIDGVVRCVQDTALIQFRAELF